MDILVNSDTCHVGTAFQAEINTPGGRVAYAGLHTAAPYYTLLGPGRQAPSVGRPFRRCSATYATTAMFSHHGIINRMLDIRFIRNNAERVQAAATSKGYEV